MTPTSLFLWWVLNWTPDKSFPILPVPFRGNCFTDSSSSFPFPLNPCKSTSLGAGTCLWPIPFSHFWLLPFRKAGAWVLLCTLKEMLKGGRSQLINATSRAKKKNQLRSRHCLPLQLGVQKQRKYASQFWTDYALPFTVLCWDPELDCELPMPRFTAVHPSPCLPTQLSTWHR